jgi:hypothetical protein
MKASLCIVAFSAIAFLTACGGGSDTDATAPVQVILNSDTLSMDIPATVLSDVATSEAESLVDRAAFVFDYERLIDGTQEAQVDWPNRLVDLLGFQAQGELTSRLDEGDDVVLGYSDGTIVRAVGTNTPNQLFIRRDIDGNDIYLVAKEDRITGIFHEDLEIQLSYAENGSFDTVFLDSPTTDAVAIQIANPENTLALSETISAVLAPDAVAAIDGSKSYLKSVSQGQSRNDSCSVSYDQYCDRLPVVHFVCSTDNFASRKSSARGLLTDIAVISTNLVLSSTDAMCVSALSAQILCHAADTICEANNGEEQTPVQVNQPPLANRRNQACREGTCARSWGDPHLITWDGLSYDFQSVGEFVLASTGDAQFEVQVRQSPFRNSQTVSVNTGVALSVDGDRVSVVREQTGERRIVLYVNDSQLDITSDIESTLPQGGIIEFSGNVVGITWPDRAEPDVYISLNSAMDVTLVNNESLDYTGLLGNKDGIAANDVQLPSGVELAIPLNIAQLYGEYADSWRVTPDTSLFTYEDGQSPDSFADRDFPRFIDSIENYSEAAQALARQACESVSDQSLAALEACMYDVLVTSELGFIQSYTTERAFEQQAALTGGIFFTGSNPTEIVRTAWQKHEGLEVTVSNPLGVIELTCEPERHGAICEYDDSTIPDAVDPGWLPAPDGAIIGMNERSKLCEFPNSCRAYADFSYFQTFLNIPAAITLNNLVVAFSGMDDGSRVSICNSRFPGCAIVDGSYVFLGGSGTTDLSSVAVAGEINRVVITQVDDCCFSNNLRSARVLLNDEEVTLVESVQ